MNVAFASSPLQSQGSLSEWELGVHQRGMIDACFEEGQYAAAIAAMDQLRSPKYKPSPSHLRLLLYLVLNPSNADLEIEHASIKIGDQTLSRTSIEKAPNSVPPEVVDSAHTLLISFVLTNSPEAIARALPAYTSPSTSAVNDHEDAESIIAQRAQCIKHAKNCWDLLSGDLTLVHATNSTTRMTRRRHLESETGDVEREHLRITENAWRIFDWLIMLFERDEEMTVARGLPRHSPWLVHQLPPPRGPGGARWEVDQILSLVLSAFDQVTATRRSVGERLLVLLVNLSTRPEINRPMFLSSTQRRLSLVSPRQLELFLSSGPPSLAMLAFRVSLCQKMITAASATLDDPAPSAQPRAARKARKVIGSSSAPASNVSTQETVTCSYKPSLPSVADILSLMKQRPLDPSQVAPDPDLELIKFTLLSSYGFLQGLPHVDKDDSWGRELRTGKLHECAERVFSDNVSRYQNMKALLDLWRGIITA